MAVRFSYLIITVLLIIALVSCGKITPAKPTAKSSTSTPTPTSVIETITTSETGTFRIVPEQSEASYEVEEEFFNRPVRFFTAIGRTQAIEGDFQLQIKGNQVELGDNFFKVDLRTLTSDDSRRDNRIRTIGLESNTYPWAEFTATAIEDFPADAAEGQDVSFQLIGDMTIRKVTNPQVFDVTARLEDRTFTGIATTSLLMKDYGFDPPDLLNILKVTDGVTVTVRFTTEAIDKP
jgi:polyisoprenoid-binding protein YceI